MHHIYRSKAVVLFGFPVREADRCLFVFTRAFGLLTVSARGVREERSKLRYILQDGAWIDGNFVRGRGGWRITTAVPDQSFDPQNRLVRERYMKMLHTINMLIPKEAVVRELFDELFVFTETLKEEPDFVEEWELAFLIRMFSQLGYWGMETPFVLSEPRRFDHQIIEHIQASRPQYIQEINRVFQTVGR